MLEYPSNIIPFRLQVHKNSMPLLFSPLKIAQIFVQPEFGTLRYLRVYSESVCERRRKTIAKRKTITRGTMVHETLHRLSNMK
jgi:hypothetical protein